MRIRPYQPGDEAAQAAIYNAAAGRLPRFKPATADEIARRYRSAEADPATRFYAVEGDRVVGYAVFDPNGRVSYPWCLEGHESARGPLLEAVLAAMSGRGLPEARAAYRADWSPVLDDFREWGFAQAREMINYVAEVSGLPHAPLPDDLSVTELKRQELPEILPQGEPGSAPENAGFFERFFWENPYFRAESLFALRHARDARIRGVALLVTDPAYADPTKLDAAMPCFRLGALGTERERHKRVNGMFSCRFATGRDAEALLGEAVRRLEGAGLSHVAAQAPSDRPELVAFYDRFFQRQGAFPVLARRLEPRPGQRRRGGEGAANIG